MNIFITGGTGFIGSALTSQLLAQGHSVTVLTRQHISGQFPLTFCKNLSEIKNFNEFDAVINLSGEPIFDKAWTPKQKQILTNSRVDLTNHLVKLIDNSDNPPSVFISSSAIGFYGDVSNSHIADENSPCGNGFLSQLCQQWEGSALQMKNPKTRVCIIRTGLVLSQQGGMLKRILPLYKLGLGGKIGNGEQHWAWISLDDHLQAIQFLLKNPHSSGIFNLVAPKNVTQKQFNQDLATSLKRPAFCSVPKWLINIILRARSQLLLDNQLIYPKKLLDLGFEFRYSCLKNYLKQHLKK
ncbi:Epimerase family protein SA0724 [Phocoenobacter uteri]|uniref:Epimerase family protein SA0724 n=1 Tax=Phocoenobacter uteri TaxID=146806 RepID=A0A379C7W6_9PAST|nr:TIGR01777 family oxidoreductase [Phocoenobacter uteri]MDG6882230.1 epimerase [Phocoenobacter uteri]SUB58383.1 Epimerase family protein SA0724 [Phocoenobacter uteri]